MNQRLIKWSIYLSLVGAIASFGQAVQANEPILTTESQDISTVATTVDEWLAQITQDTIEITRIKIERFNNGVQVLLETLSGEQLAPFTSEINGNNLVVNIPNATLSLPDGEPFQQTDPAEGISQITMTNLANNQVRVIITGVNAPPNVTFDSTEMGLALTVIPNLEMSDLTEDAIEIIVTGEQESQDEGYNPSNATTGTRTDTPLRDIPASIQVIPRQLLEDQNTTRIQDALQNLSGINKRGNYGGTEAGGYLIRGFSLDGNFRNGFRDNNFFTGVDPANIERIEVLKGPASVLYGQVEPGGIINVVTKQPLSTPYYSVDFSVGNYAFYRSSFDLSGPLTDDGSLLYRLNVAYQNSGSFRDFNFAERLLIAPVITWNISDRTSVTFDFEYLDNKFRYYVGDRFADNQNTSTMVNYFRYLRSTPESSCIRTTDAEYDAGT
ncbi:MAG: hypothetical protein Kow0091_05890 [Geminocystis sp.]